MIRMATLWALALLAQQPVDKPTLELYQQRFVVRAGQDVFRIALKDDVQPPASVQFRRDEIYAVWDEIGLTSKSPGWTFTTRLNEFPISSRFFSREEILKTAEAVKRGTRGLDAKALSGAKRLGTTGYFLARWDDSSGKPWLEALVSVDLSTPKSKPKVLGKFDGLSTATQLIDDKLMVRDGGLEVAVQTPDGWGIGRYDPKDEQFTFRQLGDRLDSFVLIGGDMAQFTEQTPYGLFNAGKVNLKTGDRKLAYQGRGAAKFIDSLSPDVIAGTRLPRKVLYWGATGSEIEVGLNDEVRRVGKYILVWTPSATPKSAKLYDPARWTEVATWTAK